MKHAWMAAFVAVVSSPLGGRADEAPPLTASIEWSRGAGAEGCIAGDAVERGVEARLGRRVFVPAERADLSIAGGVARRAPGGYTATLTTRSRDGRVLGVRELETDSEPCSSLDDAIALVLALVVDSPRTRSRLRLPPPKPPPSAAPVEGWRADVTAGAAGVVGLLPTPAIGLRLATVIDPPRVPPFEASLSVWQTSRAEVDGRGADFSTWLVGLAVCPTLAAPGRLRFVGCLGAEGGAMNASGFGLAVEKEPARLALSATGRAVVAVSLLGHLAIRAGVGLAVPILRHDFTFTAADGSETLLHRAAVVNGIAELGLGVPIP